MRGDMSRRYHIDVAPVQQLLWARIIVPRHGNSSPDVPPGLA